MSYEDSRRQFETYAAMDAPFLPDNDLSAMQVRLCRWQTENFGVPDALDLVAGIVEEYGETREAENDYDWMGIVDGAADVMIYSTQLCTLMRMDFGVALRDVLTISAVDEPLVILGRLAQAHLKAKQKIRGFGDQDLTRRRTYNAVAGLVRRLRMLERPGESIDLVDAFMVTAEKVVLKRNWKKNAATGVVT